MLLRRFAACAACSGRPAGELAAPASRAACNAGRLNVAARYGTAPQSSNTLSRCACRAAARKRRGRARRKSACTGETPDSGGLAAHAPSRPRKPPPLRRCCPVIACSALLRGCGAMAEPSKAQCQLLTGTGEVSPEFDAFVKDTGLATWGLDYQARRASQRVRPRLTSSRCAAGCCHHGPAEQRQEHAAEPPVRHQVPRDGCDGLPRANHAGAPLCTGFACARLPPRRLRLCRTPRPRRARLTLLLCRVCGWRSRARGLKACARWFSTSRCVPALRCARRTRRQAATASGAAIARVAPGADASRPAARRAPMGASEARTTLRLKSRRRCLPWPALTSCSSTCGATTSAASTAPASRC